MSEDEDKDRELGLRHERKNLPWVEGGIFEIEERILRILCDRF